MVMNLVHVNLPSLSFKVLSDEEAWDLFLEVVGDCVKNSNLQDIAKEVVKECGGVSIAIVTLGKALAGREKHEWEDTIQQLKKSSGVYEKIQSSIMLSYNFLESQCRHAQPLLLLCSLFGEDENIPMEQLVKLSIGLELFDDFRTVEETRDIVNTLVNHLKSGNFLFDGDNDGDNDGEMCVKFRDMVHDVCLSIASNQQHAFVRYEGKLKLWPKSDAQNSHTAIALMSDVMDELPAGLDYPSLRILQLQLSCDNISIPGDFFQGMTELRVFIFQGKKDRYSRMCKTRSFVPLPPTLQHLTSLRTLSLEFCKLDGDLSWIGYLRGLEILSFFNSQLDKLPSEVGKLKNLKLLDLRCDSAVKIGNYVLSCLDQLEELYMGQYNSWVGSEEFGTENSTSITELNSLSRLSTLQIMVPNSMMLLNLEESFFDKLKRFEISVDYGSYSFGHYGIIRNSLCLGEVDLSLLSDTKIHSIVRRAQSLLVEACDEEEFFIGEADSVVSPFPNLESLEIVEMSNLREIHLDSKIPDGSFCRLQELRLCELPALRHLWRGPIQPPSLGNLRVLDINTCHSFEYIFSSSIAKCLVQLKELNIVCCYELEGVVSYDGREDTKEFEKIQFPKLNFLGLEKMQNLKSFYQDPGIEDLEGDSGTLQSLLNQRVSFLSLDKMEIQELDSLKKIVDCQMQDGPANKLRIIVVSMCEKLKNFVDSPTLQNLEEVEIFDCESMEVVFDLEGLKNVGEDAPFIFDKLASIRLVNLYNLTHVWKMAPKIIQGFQNLTTFEAVNCDELRYLLTESMAKMLVNLQVLKVEFCSNIVVIIEGEEEGCSSEPRPMESIVFPQLKVLQLNHLNSFTSFCSSKYSLEFPLLDEVKIRCCPDMKVFFSGAVEAPVLKEPVKDPKGDEWIWEGNLNNGIYRGRSEVNKEDGKEEAEDEIDREESEKDCKYDDGDHDADKSDSHNG